jgi:hypothetical protein
MCCGWPIENADIVPAPRGPILQHCFGVAAGLRGQPETRLPPAAGIFGWRTGRAKVQPSFRTQG